jgi:hypothetical protein
MAEMGDYDAPDQPQSPNPPQFAADRAVGRPRIPGRVWFGVRGGLGRAGRAIQARVEQWAAPTVTRIVLPLLALR